MGTENSRIDKYQYETHLDNVHGAVRDVTLLYLYDQSRALLSVIAFVADDATLALPSETPEGHVAAQMHYRRLPQLIDMLRNEKPVYFSWWREAQALRITSAKEPVGEQELKKLFSFLYL